jgi:hypothetical protein
LKQLKDLIKKIKERRSPRLTTKKINVGTRSIKTIWTSEMAYDINMYHSLDTTDELEKLLIEEYKKLNNGNTL